jgi:hypothetical protein
MSKTQILEPQVRIGVRVWHSDASAPRNRALSRLYFMRESHTKPANLAVQRLRNVAPSIPCAAHNEKRPARVF